MTNLEKKLREDPNNEDLREELCKVLKKKSLKIHVECKRDFYINGSDYSIDEIINAIKEGKSINKFISDQIRKFSPLDYLKQTKGTTYFVINDGDDKVYSYYESES